MIARTGLALLAALLVFGSTGNLLAKSRGDDPKDPAKFAEKREKMKKKIGEALRNEVGLDEETAVKVESIMEAHHAQRKELRKVMHEIGQEIKDLLDQDSNDQEAYKKLLDEMLEVKAGMKDIMDSHMTSLREVLTPKQQAKVLVIMKGLAGKKGKHGKHKHKRDLDSDFED